MNNNQFEALPMILLFSQELAERARILKEEQVLIARQEQYTDQQIDDIEFFFKNIYPELKALEANKKNADAIIQCCMYWLTSDMLVGFIVLPASIAFFTISLAILYFSSEIYTRCDQKYQNLLQKVAVLLTESQFIDILHGQEIDLNMNGLAIKLEELSQSLTETPQNENLSIQMKQLIKLLRIQEHKKVTDLLILFLVFSVITILLQAYFMPLMIAIVMYMPPLLILLAVHFFNQFQNEKIKKLTLETRTKNAEFEDICTAKEALDEKIEAHQFATFDYNQDLATLNRLESDLSGKSIFKPGHRHEPSTSGLNPSAESKYSARHVLR